MRDMYTEWRRPSDGAVTTTVTTEPIRLGQAPGLGFPVKIIVPEQDADADTLTITVQESATENSGYRTFASVPVVTGAAGTDLSARASSLTIPFRINNTLPYVRWVLTVAGSSPDFGGVSIGVDVGSYANALQGGVYAAP